MFFLFLLLLVSSTVMYSYLHFKTRMNLRFLYMDNLLVTVISFWPLYWSSISLLP